MYSQPYDVRGMVRRGPPVRTLSSRAVTDVRRWSAGDSVVWRTGRDGTVWSAHPMTVVRDTPGLVALCIRPGTILMRRSGSRGGPRGRSLVTWDGGHEPRTWHTNRAPILNRPGDEHSVHLYWNGGDELIWWYVDLEAPWRRTRFGFDSEARDLDITVEPDLSASQWKDEDELAFAIERGPSWPLPALPVGWDRAT